ncbi:MAG: type II toxin-antitoxin system VapB family antitoxin [Leptospiraceae bacterium]|nr:type II toxin-antitoxin system VapB family antitoxin [Leptospiraceae bacterium]
MKTTLDIDEELLQAAMKIVKKNKTATIETALQEIINSEKRKTLATMFGKFKSIEEVPRR